MSRAQFAALADGRRHFHDGPIDLILHAEGAPREVEAAYRSAAARFITILDELCAELPRLRAPAPLALDGVVARRMGAAVAPFAARRFITPMAAVAGAVADEVLAAMTAAGDFVRAYVNNGGDIALHLTAGEAYIVGMAAPTPRQDRHGERSEAIHGLSLTPPGLLRCARNDGRASVIDLFGRATIRAADSARGVATSGWRGRSFSLGIADSVTVIAKTAALADAAATLIANAVDLPSHPGVERVAARDLAPESDLGERLATVHVGPLTRLDVETALDAGAREAETYRGEGLIEAAALTLQGGARLVGGAASLYKPLGAERRTEVENAFG